MLAIAGQTAKNNSTFLQSAKLFQLVNGEIEVCSSILGPLRWSGGHRREIVFSGGNAQL